MGRVPPASNIVAALKAWAVEQALPLWADSGVDKQRGGFYERLDAEGAPDRAAPKRLRVQARQIYVFGHGASLGWFPGARETMLKGLDFMVGKYRNADGKPGYLFSVMPDGAPADPLRSTYDHMFVLLALVWAKRVTGDTQIDRLIDELIAFIEQHLAEADGSYREGLPAVLPRRQNPHMHAFEAMLAWHECTKDPRALAAARNLLTLMQTRFFDQQTATIAEYYSQDWRPSGENVEPGHLAEWAALIRRYERATGSSHGPVSAALLATALRSTAASKIGLLPDEIDRAGTVTRGGHRLWPQTELARALLGESESGNSAAAAKARAALEGIARHYLEPALPGLWIENLDREGLQIPGTVPATSLYHLFGVIAETDRVLGMR